ncbi:MAG: hypothetical protein NZ534_13355, partial [Bacteroidia bacterium]|nr:hypothetical protein [Bacteroidia bacterium]
RDSLVLELNRTFSEEKRFEILQRLVAHHAFRIGTADSLKAAQYLDRMRQIAYESDDSMLIADYWACKASFLSVYGTAFSAAKDSTILQLARDAERLYSRLLNRAELSRNDLDKYMRILNFCARICALFNRHEEAYSYIFATLNMARVRKKTLDEMSASIELGNIHYALTNYEEAATYYLRALEIAGSLNSNMEVTLEHNMGLVFVAQEN